MYLMSTGNYSFIDINGMLYTKDSKPKYSGAYSEKPISAYPGFVYYDTENERPLWKSSSYGDTQYKDANGYPSDYKFSGTYAEKPSNPKMGFSYFCTDKQTTEGANNGIIIYHKGNNVWVDALGRVI